MTARKPMLAKKYAEAIAQGDLMVERGIALFRSGEYAEAIPLYERLAKQNREDPVVKIAAPGSVAWELELACLHWLIDDRPEAIRLMHGLAAGILDRSIKYASDAAGGMSQ